MAKDGFAVTKTGIGMQYNFGHATNRQFFEMKTSCSAVPTLRYPSAGYVCIWQLSATDLVLETLVFALRHVGRRRTTRSTKRQFIIIHVCTTQYFTAFAHVAHNRNKYNWKQSPSTSLNFAVGLLQRSREWNTWTTSRSYNTITTLVFLFCSYVANTALEVLCTHC